jgi:hypothetical protein
MTINNSYRKVPVVVQMNVEILLIAILLFFVSSAIFGYLDGGLHASLYCANYGETEECYRRLDLNGR